MLQGPPADRLPAYPASWYLFGRTRDLRDGLRSRDLLGRRLVAVRTRSGRLAVLDARCAHLGADLGRGRVVDETIACAFHGWRYGTDGRCTHIAATADIPAYARQRSYPTMVRHGFVYFFNGPEPLFALPFFPDAEPSDFVASAPFEAELYCPWWMVGANVFDIQHFRSAH